ncbi:MFS transporter [Actinomadura sp. NEAU-AAG7]|uniref:MFS transporter n=1 Tax=Actinomadura sp. NEAU-AAG7 TaxID=2839640 RepID=UPI001BE48FB2|nr:MFS transporter [Actinomadura sp. NEAU-AAG7]MBT2210958.1 MFS transporter [Actinomadura sp. NEAU-AAG7]
MEVTGMPAAQRPWLTLSILCAGFFMALLDGSIVNIAVPSLIADIHASYDEVLWMIDAYLLVFSTLLITTGKLGDIFGYRRLFLTGVSIFTMASVLCGLSASPGQLLAARILQGIGAALLFPQVISSILVTFPPPMRGRAFGVFGAIAGFAPIIGPVLGGLVLAHLTWRWIFFINAPIGVMILVLALVFIPDLRPSRTHRIDLGGVALVTAGLSCIVFGLIEGRRYGWGKIGGPIGITSLIATGVMLLLLFVIWQRVQRGEPLMPWELFTSERNFPAGNWIGFVFQFGMIGISLVLVLYLQMARGFSPLRTGLVLLPNAALTAVGSAFAGRVSDRVGGRLVLMTGLAALSVGLAVLALTAGADSGVRHLLPGLLIIGLASGATFAPLQQVTMDHVDTRLAGAASGVANTTRQIGGVMGTAVMGVLLSTRLNAALHHEARKHAGELPPQLRAQFIDTATTNGHRFSPPPPPHGLPPAETSLLTHLGQKTFAAAYTTAMQTTLLTSAAILAAAALFCLTLKPQTRKRPSPEKTTTKTKH